jgi:hypothetical protein
VLFTHKYFVGQASRLSLTEFCFLHLRQARRLSYAGNKKAPTQDEKGRQNGCALLIFPKLMMLELELAPDIETKVQSVAVVSSGQSLDHSS